MRTQATIKELDDAADRLGDFECWISNGRLYAGRKASCFDVVGEAEERLGW